MYIVQRFRASIHFYDEQIGNSLISSMTIVGVHCGRRLDSKAQPSEYRTRQLVEPLVRINWHGASPKFPREMQRKLM